MAMMHLNSQVQKYGGFAHGRRIFGRAPKLPIGTAGNPFFGDFTNPAGAPTAKTQKFDFDDFTNSAGIIESGFPK